MDGWLLYEMSELSAFQIQGNTQLSTGSNGTGTIRTTHGGEQLNAGELRTLGPDVLIPSDASFMFGFKWNSGTAPPHATMRERLLWGPTSASQTTVLFDRIVDSGTTTSFWPTTWYDLSGTPVPGDCPYGYEKKQPGASVLDQVGALAGLFLPHPERWWTTPLAVGALIVPTVLDTLCSGPPVSDLDLEPLDFASLLYPFGTTPGQRKIRQKIQRQLWLDFCQCQMGPMGPPRPPGPAVVNWVQPTWYVTNTVNNVSNTDIAVTLNYLLNFTAGSTYITNTTHVQTSLDTPCPPAAYEHSTVHADLRGEGAFDVHNLVGFRVEVTDRPASGLVLPGQPAYLWDMGWMSVVHPDGMLDEKRVTRDEYVWLPCSMRFAEQFTYTLRAGVEIRVTELVAPAAIELP